MCHIFGWYDLCQKGYYFALFWYSVMSDRIKVIPVHEHKRLKTATWKSTISELGGSWEGFADYVLGQQEYTLHVLKL